MSAAWLAAALPPELEISQENGRRRLTVKTLELYYEEFSNRERYVSLFFLPSGRMSWPFQSENTPIPGPASVVLTVPTGSAMYCVRVVYTSIS